MKSLLTLIILITIFISCSNDVSTKNAGQTKSEENNPEKDKIKFVLKNLNSIFASSQDVLDEINKDTMVLHRDYDKLVLYQKMMAKLQLVTRIYIENDIEHKDSLIKKAKSFNDKEIDKLLVEFNDATKLYHKVNEIFRDHQ